MANPPEDYDNLYNRVLDVSGCINVPVKLFTIFVVIKYTPKQQRHHSYFILDIMIWNFVTNLAFLFMHLNPMFPAACFRGDGLSNYLIDDERFGHAMFLFMLCSLVNCGVAFGVAFPHRYIFFAFPQFAAKIKPLWIVWICAFSHVWSTALVIALQVQWMVAYDDYPNKAELPDKPFVFCFHPSGFQKMLTIYCNIPVMGVYFFQVSLFSLLFMQKVQSQKHAIHPQTVALQRKLFMSLVITSAISLLFGAIPDIFVVVGAWCPDLPYSRLIAMVSIVLIDNHGTVYAIAYLILFKAYRDVLKQMFRKVTGKMKETLFAKSNCTVTVVNVPKYK